MSGLAGRAWQMHLTRWKVRLGKAEPSALGDWVLLPAAVALVSLVGYGSLHRDVFKEYDAVVQYFAGTELLAGHGYVGWTSHFWPPLHALLLALFGSPFATGKVIAAASFVGSAVAIYFFARLHLGRGALPWYAVLLVCSSASVVILAIKVSTHAFETCFSLAAFTLYTYWLRERSSTGLLVSAAAVLSLAALTRYTSQSLAVVMCLHIVSPRRWRDVRSAAVFCLVYASLQSLWWIPNALLNGSPWATWQYQNIGLTIFPGGEELWWWKGQAQFSGILQVIRAYPTRWSGNYVRNMLQSGWLIATTVGSSPAAAAILALGAFGRVQSLGAAVGIVKRHSLVIAACVVFSALCSVAFVYWEALMPVTILAAAAVSIEALRSSDTLFVRRLAICVVAMNLAGAAVAVREYLIAQQTDGGRLVDLRQIDDLLMADPQIRSRVVESLTPARALYAGAKWIAAPTANVLNLCDAVEYNLDPTIRERALQSIPLTWTSKPRASIISFSIALSTIFMHSSTGAIFRQTGAALIVRGR